MLSKFYRLHLSPNRKFNRKIFLTFGIIPNKSELYKEAFTHDSLKQRHKYNDAPISNERLEFLGDAVLDMVIAEVLYKKYPYRDEGFLTEMRSKVVSRKQLAVLGRQIGLQPFIQRSKSMKMNPQTASILIGNGLESFLGAVYLDKGYDKCRKYILSRIVERFINFKELENTEISYKSRLHKWCQQNHRELSIDYLMIDLENNKFVHQVGVKIDDKLISDAKNHSKKRAMEQACQRVCEEMDI